MPWAPSDADRHKQNLSDRQKRQWAEVANSALQKCLAEGGERGACEASAVRQANGAVGEPANQELKQPHHYQTRNRDYEIRYETHQGRRHMVIPVVMMVEGVHAGSHGPMLHLADELGRFVDTWNGIPVAVEHPSDGGHNVSANQPHIIDGQTVGRVYNAFMDEGRLRAEAWIDEEAIRAVSPEALQYIVKGMPLEVSVGVFTDEEMITGVWGEEHYEAVARNHRPDHLALLPGGTGACSWDDGCGVRAHASKETKVMSDNTEVPKNLEGTMEEKGKGLTFKVTVTDDKATIGREDLLKAMAGQGLVAHEIGYAEIAQTIQSKLDAMDTDTRLHFLVDVFDDRFIYKVRPRMDGEVPGPDSDGSMYQRTYEVDDNDNIEFTGEPVAVTKKVEYVAMKSSEGEENMAKDVKDHQEHVPCCPEKVEMLIQNELTSFGEGDREILGTLKEAVVDKMLADADSFQANIDALKADVEKLKADSEKAETEKAGAEPQMNKEQAIQVLEEHLKDPDKFLALLPPKTKATMEHGLKLYETERKDKIAHILANTNEGVFSEEKLEAMSDQMLDDLVKAIKAPASYAGMGPSRRAEQPATYGEPLLPPGVSTS